MPIPIGWEGHWHNPQEWAEEWANGGWEIWQDRNPAADPPDPAAVQRTVLEFRSYAEKWGGFDPLKPFGVETFLHVPSPTVTALPVNVFTDDTPGLTAEQAAAVDNPDALEPPVVEKFTTEALGVGLKTTADGLLDPEPDDLPGTRGVWVQVRYAFAVPGRQAVVTVAATDTDLGRMTAAQVDLDAFVRTITLKENVPASTPVPWSPSEP